jgi:hypothetical protein
LLAEVRRAHDLLASTFNALAEQMSLAGLMVSAVAHGVTTPLSVVANIAEMLRLIHTSRLN